MSGEALTEVAINRHPGKPTSGRFVYSTESHKGFTWQCDLCGEPEVDHVFPTVQTAFAAALSHAVVCRFVSANRRKPIRREGQEPK